MKSNTYRNRLPVPLLLAAFFCSIGSLSATAQAANFNAQTTSDQPSSENRSSESRVTNFPGLNLTISNKKSRLTPNKGSVMLSRPFGGRGPALQISRSLPEYAQRSHRMTNLHGVSRVQRTDAYLFLEKRW